MLKLAFEGIMGIMDVTAQGLIKTLDVENCSSCGGAHIGMLFYATDNAPKGYTHKGMCPITQRTIWQCEVKDESASK